MENLENGGVERPSDVPANTLENNGNTRQIDEIGKTQDTRRRYFRMFEEYALKMRPVHEIAKEFGCSKQSVYLALQWVKDHTPSMADGIERLVAIQRKEDSVRKLMAQRDALMSDMDQIREEKKKVGPGMFFSLEAMVRQIREEESVLWKLKDVLKSDLESAAKVMGDSLAQLIPEANRMLAMSVRQEKRDEPLPHDRLTESGVAGTITPPENKGGQSEPSGDHA